MYDENLVILYFNAFVIREFYAKISLLLKDKPIQKLKNLNLKTKI